MEVGWVCVCVVDECGCVWVRSKIDLMEVVGSTCGVIVG